MKETDTQSIHAIDLFEERHIRPLLYPSYVVDFARLETPYYNTALALIADLKAQGISSYVTSGGVRIYPEMGAGLPNQIAEMVGVCSSYGVRPREGTTRLEDLHS